MKKLHKTFCFTLAIVLTILLSCRTNTTNPDENSNSSCTTYIDVHQHFASNSNFIEAAENLVKLMDSLSIDISILMPPPSAYSQIAPPYVYTALLPAINTHPERLKLVGGGGILNKIIDTFVNLDSIPTATDLANFEASARAIAANGIAGFGEMAVLHISYADHHPYIAIPANHPMMLRLADVAADLGLPIDIHLELVTEPTPVSSLHPIYSNLNNPDTLPPNLEAFDSLLVYNVNTKIVWSHVGWDNIGYMTVDFLRTMLNKHQNLYCSIKMLDNPGNVQDHENRPLNGKGEIWDEWETLITEFSERFILGSDEFISDNSGKSSTGSPSTRGTWSLLDELPVEVVRMIACENPKAVYKLDD
jgi:hypothetical protein